MKKVVYALFMLLICVSVSAQVPEQYKIHVIDTLVFQNKTPFDIENLQVAVQDPMAYTYSNYTYNVKVPSMKSVGYPILTGEKLKKASRAAWQFNERRLPVIMSSNAAVYARLLHGDVSSVVYPAILQIQEDFLKDGILINIDILGVKPVWCTKNGKRQKCKGEFVIQKDSAIPYKFIISQAKEDNEG